MFKLVQVPKHHFMAAAAGPRPHAGLKVQKRKIMIASLFYKFELSKYDAITIVLFLLIS